MLYFTAIENKNVLNFEEEQNATNEVSVVTHDNESNIADVARHEPFGTVLVKQ
ncbi:hypothetical protein TcasGA2_TC031570 [Tribolium castaneum]|uniref:Uncharacterized protein n=1 Tax=Tribolium castaneum TaxID=7070 RepID=A0A139WPU2_TRICA|nr:hypothetical protein TcasGA2_TC031570 [Tribolium castaneum]